jgi:ribosomal protein S21
MMGGIADLIDGMVNDSTAQTQLFTAALAKPHVFDDATIDRALRCYRERVQFIEIYSEQLRRSRNENPDAKQRREIERLESQTSRLRQLNAQVLRLAAEIRNSA